MTTLFLKLKNGISIALNIIEIFGNLSGLKLNRSKTEGIWLGRLKHCKDKFENITWTIDMGKYLGFILVMTYQNANKVILKNNYKKQEIINTWNKRNLIIRGKITVVKSLLLLNITYIASVCTIHKEYIQSLKTMIYNCIYIVYFTA